MSENAVPMTAGGVDLEEVRPSFDRISRLVSTLFKARRSAVVLVAESGDWRTNRGEGWTPPIIGSHSFVAETLAGGPVLWVEDAPADPRFAHHPHVVGEAAIRFYAAAPIILRDGRRVGVVSVLGSKPRAYDAEAAAHLIDFAAIAADECERHFVQRDLVEAEGAKTAAEVMMARFAENAPIALCMTDREMRVIEASPLWRGELSAEAVRGRTIFDIYSQTERHRETYAKCLTGERFQHERLPMIGSDGAENFSRYEINPWRNAAGEVGGLLIMWMDITNTVRALEETLRSEDRLKRSELALVQARDEAEAANRAKSAFLANMSHEIRTPLNGVLGMAQAMAAGELSQTQRERLTVVQESGETLLAILNDILDLSKIEAGKLDLESAEFDLERLMDTACCAFTAVAADKDVTFQLAVEPAARGVYLGDATRVRQLLYNLVSNALKFTTIGEVRVVAGRRGEDLTITVSDTGVGIPADRLASLFQPFVQADASTTREYGGTGLGLSICRQLAELMGGTIEASSTEGAGSTFVAILPLPRVGETVPCAAVAAQEPAPRMNDASVRVLAAEDNPVNQLVLKALLGQIGVDPHVVADGREAVEAWEAAPWDVILMDVQMPVMDGPAAVREIRAREAATGRDRTPVIALTANAMAHQVAEYRAAGMDDFVAKPIEVQRLFERLALALENREAARKTA